MPGSPFDLILILTVVWLLMAAALFEAFLRIRRLERRAGVRPAGHRRRKESPRQARIRTIPVRVERRRAG